MNQSSIRRIVVTLVLIAGVLVALALISCTQQSAKAPKQLEPASLRLDWLPFGYQTPFFLAYDKGWYADEGIALYIGDGSGSLDAVKFVGTGRDTFGFAQATELIRGISEGVPAKMIALLQRKNATIFLYNDGAGIQKPKDLEGKTMGGSPEDMEDPAIRAFFAVNNADLTKVTLKTVSGALKRPMLGQKQYDFISTHITAKTALEEAMPGVKLGRFLISDSLEGLIGYGVLTSNNVIEKKPDLVRGFVAATVKGWEYSEKNPKEALEAMKKYRPEKDIQSPGGLEEVLPLRDTKRTAGKPWGFQSKEDWQDTIGILAKYAGLKAVPKPEDVFTNDFLPKK